MTRQQRWARKALACVSKQKGPTGQKKAPAGSEEYRTLCMKMPILLQQSGLVQALAFVRSRSESGGVRVGQVFSDDLAQVYEVEAANDADAGLRLLKDAQQAALPAYLAMTRDLIEVSLWFRRFAQSELPSPETDGER